MTTKNTCGNPLFLQWMEEIRDAAREKGSRSAESYHKACRSLEVCPVTYQHPRDLVVLAHIGIKTISMLEKRWIEWRKENETDHVQDNDKSPFQPSAESQNTEKDKISICPAPINVEQLQPGCSQSAVKRKRATIPRLYTPLRGSGAYGILIALVLAIDQPDSCTQVFLTKSEIIRVAKLYCETSYEQSAPGSYSTAWSGMKTLVSKGCVYVTGNPHKYCLTEAGYNVGVTIRNLRPEFAHMTKHPFCQISLDKASNLVSEPYNPRSSPPLETDNESSNIQRNFSSTYASPSNPLSPSASVLETFDDVDVTSSDRFHFWYITSSGSRTPMMTFAHLRLDPDKFINLRRIEFKYSQRSHPFVAQLRLVDDFSTAKLRDQSKIPTLYAYMMEADAPPKCSMFGAENGLIEAEMIGCDSAGLLGIDSPNVVVSKPSTVATGKSSSSNLSDEEHILPLAKRRPPTDLPASDVTIQTNICTSDISLHSSKDGPPSQTSSSLRLNRYDNLFIEKPSVFPGPKISRAATATASIVQPRAASLSSLTHISSHSSNTPSRSFSSAAVLQPQSTISHGAPHLSSDDLLPTPLPDGSGDNIISPSNLEPTGIPPFSASDAIIFPTDSYDIILVVDTREVESKTSRDKITETLGQRGIRVETRALKLGDMCWVAQRKDVLGGEEDECILDYVVERKRLDDLVSSIKDGRYNEQCFRLQNACLTNVYYIVEDWQVNQRMEQNGLAIMTCKSQIQVHNRFFLKETHSLAETINFLAVMTNVIKTLHRGKPLQVIPTRFLSRLTYKPLQTYLKLKHPDEIFHTSFNAYQELNDKSASQTLKGRFARMMMAIKGMSAERVSSLLDQWDTPRELWESMKERNALPDNSTQDQSQGRARKRRSSKGFFFAERVQGEARRKIGDALSESLWTALMG
ncbi:hypothetical protein L204_101637 [Cryptococcus depauperatus]